MGAKITEQERQAISSYVTGGGVVHKCPPGSAIGADSAHITVFSEWLAEHGLSVSPIMPAFVNHGRQKAIEGRSDSVDAFLKHAA